MGHAQHDNHGKWTHWGCTRSMNLHTLPHQVYHDANMVSLPAMVCTKHPSIARLAPSPEPRADVTQLQPPYPVSQVHAKPLNMHDLILHIRIAYMMSVSLTEP